MTKEHMDAFGLRLVENERPTYSAEEVRKYLEEPGTIQWLRVGDLLNSAYDACVDGRETKPVVGNPGGDVTRLAEAIIAVGEVAHRKVTPVEIMDSLTWYVDKFGTFYMHTDTHALTRLGRALSENPRMGGKTFGSAEEVHDYVLNPDSKHQLLITRYLMDPKYVGCGHYKLMLENPTLYGMSTKVLRGVMTAFFDLKWNSPDLGKKLVYPALEGDHKEGAVVNIFVPEEKLDESTLVPMVRPTDGRVSVFVNHPQVVNYLEERVVRTMVKERVIPDLDIEPELVGKYMDRLAQQGTRQTVSALAGDLPVYQFELRKD